jgi:hypothetical protein
VVVSLASVTVADTVTDQVPSTDLIPETAGSATVNAV